MNLMARSGLWGIIALLHWPFCLYLSVIAGTAITDNEFESGGGGIPAASQDDADRAINVPTLICVVACGFGTVIDLMDIVILVLVLPLRQREQRDLRQREQGDFLAKTLNCLHNQTKPLRNQLPKSGYLIVISRFIMIIFWITVLVWGLVPTNVLMYIDYNPGGDLEEGLPPNYSNTVIGFICLLLLFDFISFTSPLIQHCVLFYLPQKLQIKLHIGKVEKQPEDGHREIGFVSLGQVKTASSIPIGHTLSVEEV